MSSDARLFNPFPGLRPFEPDDDHLFFGRERETDELLRRLRSTRFVAVIGTSGSGKSSLVNSGLIPALYSGFMTKAGSSWRVAKFRPGVDPIGHLAASLNRPGVLLTDEELVATNRILLEATIRRGALGLVDAVHQARIPPGENVLVVVDQFEELFRFRRSRQIENAKDEAAAFVRLLLEATQQVEVPIYVVLTMRADFIGDCIEYTDLPEAVNAGQYLIPRMTRDELRSAIAGPVAVGGGTIAPRLVLRLLNDLGVDQDQLPVLQHALMRTWAHWEEHRLPAEPIDIEHYEAIGTLRDALSRHADEAYQEVGSDESRRVTERIFKALTDTFTDPRGVRRPTLVQDLSAVCEAPESEVIRIIELFRRPGRSFLTPHAAVPLSAQSLIDVSHESLMRRWSNLITWAEEERISIGYYMRLSQAATWFAEGTSGLWRDPELELGLRWKQANRPTAAWAERNDLSFARAMEFLERSVHERDRVVAERERDRRKRIRVFQYAASVLGVLLLMTAALAYVARKENVRAESNLELAQNAVAGMLSSAGRDEARVAEDVPQMEAFRKELLGKARAFYGIFMTQKPANERARRDMAEANYRLGDIDRLQGALQRDSGVAEYTKAALGFESLSKDYPTNIEYRVALGNSLNWLAETLRPQLADSVKALDAYAKALRVQEDLAAKIPENGQFRQQLARTRYNRGILFNSMQRLADAALDFRVAIQLLEPLATKEPHSAASEDLARAYNNLGSQLMSEDSLSAARQLFGRAIALTEGLLRAEPAKREYTQELATFSNNLALVLVEQGQFDLAERTNRGVLEAIRALARPGLWLERELASAHSLRCRILLSQKNDDAPAECQQALDIVERLTDVEAIRVDFQPLFLDLGYNYESLGRTYVSAGSVAKAREALARLERLLPKIAGPAQRDLRKAYEELHQQLRGKTRTER